MSGDKGFKCRKSYLRSQKSNSNDPLVWVYHPAHCKCTCCPGRAPPRNTTVDLSSGNVDVPPNMASWASFHNGVAAGLKIAPASQIDSAWIVYNKPKHAELANEYAGFLMALGLNGHLTKLATLNIHDYLTKVSALPGLLQWLLVAPRFSSFPILSLLILPDPKSVLLVGCRAALRGVVGVRHFPGRTHAVVIHCS